MSTCNGITASGRRCTRKSNGREFCYQHAEGNRFNQLKPDECPVCCESLENQRTRLECGHWIHIECIIRSAKEECPLCRCKLTLPRRARQRIQELTRQREEERIEEEHEELMMGEFNDEPLYYLIYEIIEVIMDRESDHFGPDTRADTGT